MREHAARATEAWRHLGTQLPAARLSAGFTAQPLESMGSIARNGTPGPVTESTPRDQRFAEGPVSRGLVVPPVHDSHRAEMVTRLRRAHLP